MDLAASMSSEARFEVYLEALVGVIGHADRAAPLRDYCLGLLLPIERKSVEPLAAVTAPSRASAQHQSLLHLVSNGPWSDDRVLAKVQDLVLPSIERQGPIEAWIVDDTSFPKQGRHSVGVQRQYCGQLGKQENCQVAVSLSIANHHASLPIAYRLYLPEDWAQDGERRRKAKVPETIGFQTKPEIALEQIRSACASGVPRGAVLVDAAYGNDTRFRSGISELDLAYVAGILPNTSLWAPEMAPLPPATSSGRGRPAKRLRRDEEHRPVSAKALALTLAAEAWQEIRWREGSNDWLASRFARLRVCAAHRDYRLSEPRAEEWLLVEWPQDEAEPTKYWLSTLAEDFSFEQLVDLTKLRWRIERDYRELKQEVGLGHYEGRGWRGFHHHASLCIAAYGFLVSEKETIPPSGPSAASWLQKPAFPNGFRSRGAAAPTRVTHSQLDGHSTTAPDSGSRKTSAKMSMLQAKECRRAAISRTFMTQ